MKDAEANWSPLCRLVSQLHCWVRIAWRVGAEREEGRWGQLLTIPVDGYLEGPGAGPVPIRDVEWVEISTNLIKGGMAGRPLEMVSVKEEIISGLREMQLKWELRDSTWSKERMFEEESVQLIRVRSPFGLTSVG